MSRTVSIIIAIALLICTLVACGQGSSIDGRGAADAIDQSQFELTAEEQAALASGDESGLELNFGDPALGTPVYSSAPSSRALEQLLIDAERFSPGAKGASTYSKGKTKKDYSCNKEPRKWKTPKCKKPKKQPRECRKITGICNLTERFWETSDGCTTSADVTYRAKVTVKGGSAKGIEVTFLRDGVEVGRAETDKDGIATFTETGVSREPHTSAVCVASSFGDNDNDYTGCSTCGSKNKNDCKDNAHCDGNAGKGNDSRSASTYNKNDGKDKCPCDGNAGGGNDWKCKYGCKPGKCKSGCKSDKHKSCKPEKPRKDDCETPEPPKDDCETPEPPKDDCETPEPPKDDCGCEEKPDCIECEVAQTPGDCFRCVTEIVDDTYCSEIGFAVYTTAIHGAVTGKGLIDSCNPNNPRGKASMIIRSTYKDGVVQGYLTYQDGDIWFNKQPIKWMLISGVHSYFGSDNWMVHAYDGGPDFKTDWFEIWHQDPCTKCCYHCGGFLVGCYVKVSYKYTAQCP
jgi:hypothetical protein